MADPWELFQQELIQQTIAAFEERWGSVEAKHGPTTPTIDLTVCPAGCPGCLVYPVSWREVEDERWSLDLRCPECWGERTLPSVAHSIVERFDVSLNRATDDLLGDLFELSVSNEEDFIGRFVGALAVDAILPCDFGWPS